MPELPEVETVRRGLAPFVVGQRVRRVEMRRPDLRFPLPDRFSERLEGETIQSLERRAKYLIARLSGGEDLVMHLGMTGRFTIQHDGMRETPGEFAHETGGDPAHDHLVFTFAGGARLIYNDPRRFGFMLMMAHAEQPSHALFRSLGVEPLSDDLSAEYLARRAKGKKTNLKAFLMDQRIVAGLGNIYASEALFQAKLLPGRKTASLADRKGHPVERTERLVAAIKDVLRKAIDAGGSTLRDYRHTDGATGSFQKDFAVYGRDGQLCRRRGCGGIIRRSVQAGRATFYCSRCQR